MATKVEANVAKMVEDLKANPSARFSKSDFQALVYGVLADKDFNAKKYLFKNGDLQIEEYCINDAMKKFMDKLLKHAGMDDSKERSNVIDSFVYGPRDVEWVSDAVDEAMAIYVENGKSMRIFRDRMLTLSFKQITRTGKYAGQTSYKKSVLSKVPKKK